MGSQAGNAGTQRVTWRLHKPMRMVSLNLRDTPWMDLLSSAPDGAIATVMSGYIVLRHKARWQPDGKCQQTRKLDPQTGCQGPIQCCSQWNLCLSIGSWRHVLAHDVDKRGTASAPTDQHL
jgi:hypothetical protein